MDTLSLRVPESLHRQLRELAEQQGVSVNQLAVAALSEKMSALMAGEHLEQRTRRGSRDKFDDALHKLKDVEPEPHDKL